MSKIFNLNEIPEELLPVVGGKARGLNRLVKLGYTVPEAFIVTDINDDDDLEDVVAAYTEHGFGAVSVRSSATLEDGTDFSAAGQFLTVLDVTGGEAVKDAVRQCVASLHSITAENYSKTFLKSEDSRMTVVVQRMVKAACAGVIFSRAPMRPGFVLVEAVPGLGENLVSGKMSAQQYRVNGQMIEKMPQNPILTREQAVELAAGGKKAEEKFGQPMDLEWAIDTEGTIQWLQARPITIEESVTMNELDYDGDASNTVYTTGNIGECMPGAVSPLNISTNVYSLDWAVMKTYVETGCYDHELPPYRFIANYYNHLFFNMTSLYAVGHSVMGTSKQTMDISICGKVLEGMPDSDMKDKPVWRKMLNLIPFLKLVMGGDRAKEGITKVVEDLKFDLSQDMNGIYAQILDNFKYMKLAHYWHYGASYYSGGAGAMLTNALDKFYEDKDQMTAVVAGCLTQIDDFESANILRSMKALGELMVAEDPTLKEATIEQIADYMDHRASAKVLEARDNFMKRHGYRGMLENDIMNLSWEDDPVSFYNSLRSVLAGVGRDDAQQVKPWTEYADEVLSHFSPRKAKSVMQTIEKARKGVCYREFTKSRVIYVLNEFKKAYRALADLMVENGMLPERDCIYFLTQDEVGRLLSGEQSLVKKAMARKRLFPQQQELNFPYAAMGVPQPLAPVAVDPDATTFTGTPVSRGMATGKARVVHTPEDATKLEKGEIMIAGCTDIGWTPYYSVIGGLVTEIGSSLSHGVVVAREYALPTVVNVASAMQLIKTGDTVTIDGNTGTVIINARA